MSLTRDHSAIAANALRYLDVLASEWRAMREYLVPVEPAFSSTAFGACPRRLDVEIAATDLAAADLAGVPSVLRLDTLAATRDELAAVLPRMRFADRSLAGEPLTGCVSLLINPYVPRSRGGTLAVVAPRDDEAGRMMARALWVRELPDGWSVSDAVFEEFGRLLRQALEKLAGDPFALSLVRTVLASVILVDHPTQRAGVCSASATHVWVAPSRCPDAGELADILFCAAVNNALYVDEMVHAKWDTDPQTLDSTTVEAPLIGTVQPTEYDTAFHAVHVEYLRLRRDGADLTGPAGQPVRDGIAALLAHPGHLTGHGTALLTELCELCAEGQPGGGRAG